MNKFQYPFLVSMMVPSENRGAAFQAAISNSLPISTNQRVLFSVLNANSQENEHRRDVASAEIKATAEVVDYVNKSVSEGMVTSEELHTNFPTVSRLNLNERLAPSLKKISLVQDAKLMMRLDGNEPAIDQIMGAVQLVYDKATGNVRKSDYDKYPIVKKAFTEDKELEGQFEKIVRDIRRVAKADTC